MLKFEVISIPCIFSAKKNISMTQDQILLSMVAALYVYMYICTACMHVCAYLFIYVLAVIPVLRTSHPPFFFTLNELPQSLCLALLSHATAIPVCMCVTHHLPFYWFWNVLPFLSLFPPRHTIGHKARTQIAFGGSFELNISPHKASLFRKAFVPSFLKIRQPFFE